MAHYVTVMFPPPTATAINRDTQKNSFRLASVINQRLDKVFYTEEEMDQFYQTAWKFLDGSINIEEVSTEFKLRIIFLIS